MRREQTDRNFADDIFKLIFLSENFKIWRNISLLRSIWQYASIGSGTGLKANRRQAIACTNVDQYVRGHRTSIGHNQLKQYLQWGPIASIFTELSILKRKCNISNKYPWSYLYIVWVFREITLCVFLRGRATYAGMILGVRPANERRRYKVTPSLTGWAQN